MSKINLKFKGKSYSIDKSLLSGAISSLETAFSKLENGGNELPSIITWDGNLEGHEVIEGPDNLLVKVSDAVYTKEQLVGAILVTGYRYDRADSYLEMTEDHIHDTIDFGVPGMIDFAGIIRIIYSAEDVIANGAPDSLSNGVWFSSNDDTYTKQLFLPWAEDKPDIEK